MTTEELIELASKRDDTNAQLVHMYEKLRSNVIEAQASLTKFSKAVQNICPHPNQYRFSHSIENDDGYGRWWTTRYVRCQLCGKEKRADSDNWYATK